MRRKTWVGMLICIVGGMLFGGEGRGVLGASGTTAIADKASQKTTAGMLSHQFVTIAYNRTRSTAIPSDLGAEEATILLRTAHPIDPANPHTLKLLIEAAGAAGQTDVQRDALRTLIRLDPGDLVAQVKYIDLLASGTQAIDERARTFQSALDKANLDPQIRSEMAMRLARIAEERGDMPGAKGLLRKAIQLNDVNVGALRELVKLAETGGERMGTIVALLTANPLQPDAWVEGSRILAGVNAYSQAADFLTTAVEQIQVSGEQPGADLYLELALDLATAGRLVEAYPILSALSKLPDAPMSALVAAQLLSREYTPPATGPASQPAAGSPGDLPGRIESKLKEEMKAVGGKDVPTEAMADAIWVELAVLSTANDETAAWLKKYESIVGADDPGVARLRGWWVLTRAETKSRGTENSEEARGILEKTSAGGDALSQLGLAKVLIEEKKSAEAEEQLRSLWARSGGTGVLASQVAQLARTSGIKLSSIDAGVMTALKALPTTTSQAHRHLRDLTLLSTDFTQRNFVPGDPILLHFRVSNTSDHAAPVGAEGLVSTTVGLSARSIGVDAKNLGVYAIEDLQRVYRLERQGFIDDMIRVDQGPLAELLGTNPRQSFTVEMAVVTGPRGSLKNATPGLGGERIPLGVFERGGYGIGTERDITRALDELKTADVVGQMVRVQSLALVMEMISDEKVKEVSKVDEAPQVTETREALRESIVKGVTPLVKSDSPIMRAWMVLNLPQDGLNELQDVVMGMGTDPDPVVRVAWGWRMALMPTGIAEVKKVVDGEKDAMVKEWFGALIKDAAIHSGQTTEGQ